MEQYQTIKVISNSIIDGGLADCIFLKGSFARGNEDEFSNIDLYVIVDDSKYEKFLEERVHYLSSYSSILYYTFVYYRFPQMICIYENGIHVNLYTSRIEDLSQTDKIAIYYDPKNRLANYNSLPLSFNSVEIGDLVSSFCLNALEFYSAYNRGDSIYSLRLASHLSVDLGTFIRNIFEPEYAKLGLKNFMQNIDDETKQKYLEIIKKLKLDSVLECVVLMFVLIDSYIMNLPLKIAEHINFDFYHFTKKRILSIVRK